MKVLKAIGGFFAKIWNWIKNTAWVQPLLIVGIIFGVVFSIRPIVDGIQSAINSRNEAQEYFQSNKKSLKDGSKSAADKLVENIYDTMTSDAESEYGEKYFLVFVSKTCSECESAYKGIKFLKNNASDYNIKNFKLYTIYIDEVTDETTTDKPAFGKFADRNEGFFNEVGAAIENSIYYSVNQKIDETSLRNFANADYEKFETPTFLLIDNTEGRKGVSELMFGLPGSGAMERADLLNDCWNHQGDFDYK